MSVATRDLSDLFFVNLAAVAKRLETSALFMAKVMKSEADVRANAHNPNGHASGLIQFMPKTLLNLGWTKGDARFRAEMNAVDQLPFVERYYTPYKGKLGSVAGLYVATFLPALIDHAEDKDYALCVKDGRLGWAYSANAVFDANKDLKITVQELEDAVDRNCVGQRWAEIAARISGEGLDQEHLFSDDGFDLSTIRGLQAALAEIGFDPGPIDGYNGPKTAAAVAAFQESVDIGVDGIYGPITREALKKRLGL